MAHRCSIDVRFNELDPYNHVNHSYYLTYFEVGRSKALDACGVPLETLAERGVHIYISKVEVRFLAPALAGQRLVVETRQNKQKRRASTVWEQTIYHQGSSLTTATVVGALVGPDGKPMRRPTWLDEAFEGLETGQIGQVHLFEKESG